MIKNAYTIDKKLKVIDIAIKNGVKYASRTTKIHQSCIYKWVRDKTRFESIKNKTKVRRIGAGGRTILSAEEELGVRDWILSRNDKDLLVNFQTAQRHCKETFSQLDCTFSTGWFRRFKNRHHLSVRRVTSYSHRPNQAVNNARDRIAEFKDTISQLDQNKILVNMDETPVWFDNQSRYTVTTKGTKHVKQRATSNEKKRITVVLSCCSNGQKQDPVVILKNKYTGPIPDNISVVCQEKAWMNSNIMVEWLKQRDFTGKHLLLDSFSGHKSKAVLHQLNYIDHTFIPPRCTSELQPLDIGVNKPFKDMLRAKWNTWIESGQVTKYGNYKAAPTSLLLAWIAECWKNITTCTVLNSFRAALS